METIQEHQQKNVSKNSQEQEPSFNEKLELAKNLSKTLDDFTLERDKFSSFIFDKKLKVAEKRYTDAKAKFIKSVGDLFVFISKLKSINETALAGFLRNEFPIIYIQALQKHEGSKKRKREEASVRMGEGSESDSVDLLAIGAASLVTASLINSDESPVNEVVPTQEGALVQGETSLSPGDGDFGGGGAGGDY